MAGSRTALGALCALAVLQGSVACATEQPPDRGDIVSTAPVAQLSADETAAYLAESRLATPVHNGIDAYRVIYRTITPHGDATTASGLVVLPRTDATRLRAVGYAHGTMVRRADAASVSAQNRPDRARAYMFAATGYAVFAPDYLGLGEGPGTHPYAHAPSEASASLDLLRATRTLAARQARELDPNVLVTGFSQGGQAATALGKELQAGAAPGFGLAALAAVSGPFAVQHIEAPGGFDGRVTPSTAVVFLAYWVTSMNRIYHLYDHPSEAFQEPYAGVVEQLFDGNHDGYAIATALPGRPEQLLTPRFIAWASAPTGPALRAMTDSDSTCDWMPRAPVRLYAARGDRTVLYANSEQCLRQLRGDTAILTDLGAVDHATSAQLAFPRILSWFQQQAPAA